MKTSLLFILLLNISSSIAVSTTDTQQTALKEEDLSIGKASCDQSMVLVPFEVREFIFYIDLFFTLFFFGIGTVMCIPECPTEKHPQKYIYICFATIITIFLLNDFCSTFKRLFNIKIVDSNLNPIGLKIRLKRFILKMAAVYIPLLFLGMSYLKPGYEIYFVILTFAISIFLFFHDAVYISKYGKHFHDHACRTYVMLESLNTQSTLKGSKSQKGKIKYIA